MTIKLQHKNRNQEVSFTKTHSVNALFAGRYAIKTKNLRMICVMEDEFKSLKKIPKTELTIDEPLVFIESDVEAVNNSFAHDHGNLRHEYGANVLNHDSNGGVRVSAVATPSSDASVTDDDHILETLKVQNNISNMDVFASDYSNKSQEGSVTSSATQETYRWKQRTRNNAATRKYRMKRKRERETLIARNLELEQEQRIFQEKIANLQTEMQVLKHSSIEFRNFDLKNQNLFLRAEVKRHKGFIHYLSSMMHNFPESEFSRKEQVELANNRIRSGFGKVLGMCYNSVINKSIWKVLEYKPKFKRLSNIRIVVRYQYLPEGSTPETATRLNVREDIYNIPKASSVLLQPIFLGDDSDISKAYFNLINHGSNSVKSSSTSTIERVDFSFGDGDVMPSLDEKATISSSNSTIDDIPNTKLLRIRETRSDFEETISSQPGDCITLEAHSFKNVESYGFPDIDQALNFVEPQENHTNVTKALVAVHTQVPPELRGQMLKHRTLEGCRISEESFFNGVICKDSDNRKTSTWTMITSQPIIKDRPWWVPAKLLTSFEDLPQGCKVPSIVATKCKALYQLLQKG